MMPYTHSELVEVARRWLAHRQRCPVVITEMGNASREEPDAIGWVGAHSILVECKASRADFLSNGKKNHGVGMGRQRYFLTPRSLIAPTELPDGWGLVEWDGKRYHTTRESTARYDYAWAHEITLLLSALRRVGPMPTGVSVRVYTDETRNRASLTLETGEAQG